MRRLCQTTEETCLFDKTVQFAAKWNFASTVVLLAILLWIFPESSVLLRQLHFKMPMGAHMSLVEC